jgi:hypothetical protein
VFLLAAVMAAATTVLTAVTIRRHRKLSELDAEELPPEDVRPEAVPTVLPAGPPGQPETALAALVAPGQHIAMQSNATSATLVQDGVVSAVHAELEPIAERVDELQRIFDGLLRRGAAERRERIDAILARVRAGAEA